VPLSRIFRSFLACASILLCATGAAAAQLSERFKRVEMLNPQPSKSELAAIWSDTIAPGNARAIAKPPPGESAPMFIDAVRFGDVLLSVDTISPRCEYDGPGNTDNYPRQCPARLTRTVRGLRTTIDVPGLVCSIFGDDGIDPLKIGVFATFDDHRGTIEIHAKTDVGGAETCNRTISLR
jgi:hypothetical protein